VLTYTRLVHAFDRPAKPAIQPTSRATYFAGLRKPREVTHDVLSAVRIVSPLSACEPANVGALMLAPSDHWHTLLRSGFDMTRHPQRASAEQSKDAARQPSTGQRVRAGDETAGFWKEASGFWRATC
jgi:hypothetical protein